MDSQERSEKDKKLDSLIQSLWTDPTFPASYAGARAMQTEMRLLKNIKLPVSRIIDALSRLPTYVNHLKQIKR